MTSFVDWATAAGVSMTISNPAFSAIGASSWARTDREELIRYKSNGVSLVTETWSAFVNNYAAQDTVMGRVSAGSGAVEEVPFSVVAAAVSGVILGNAHPLIMARGVFSGPF